MAGEGREGGFPRSFPTLLFFYRNHGFFAGQLLDRSGKGIV